MKAVNGITARKAMPQGVFLRLVEINLAGASTMETKSARSLAEGGGVLAEAWRRGWWRKRFLGRM